MVVPAGFVVANTKLKVYCVPIYSDQLRKLAEQKTALESQLDDMKPLSDTETFQTARSSWIFNKKSAQMDGKSDLAGPSVQFTS